MNELDIVPIRIVASQGEIKLKPIEKTIQGSPESPPATETVLNLHPDTVMLVTGDSVLVNRYSELRPAIIKNDQRVITVAKSILRGKLREEYKRQPTKEELETALLAPLKSPYLPKQLAKDLDAIRRRKGADFIRKYSRLETPPAWE